jgi:integrase
MAEKRIHVWVQHFKDREHLVLQWLDPDTGKRKSKSAETSDPEKAEAARVDHESDLNNGRYSDAGKMTWHAFRQLFEKEHLPGVRPGTAKKYREVFDLFEGCVSPARIGAITVRMTTAFLAAMRERPVRGRVGMGASTMHNYLRFLRGALRWAVRQKLLNECPEFPAVKVPKKKPQPVALESFERLLEKAPAGQWRTYLLCGWLAGLRLDEAFSLEWEPTEDAPWVDFPRRRIVLPAAFAKAAEDQWVPIDPELQQAIEALPRAGRKVFQLTGPSGRRLALSSVSDRVIRLAKRAGVKLSMHTLRKGFGCRYAGKVPAQVLQRLMRHSDIKTTMGYYANVDAAVEEAVLGPRCNNRRNTGVSPEGDRGEGVAAKPGGAMPNG